MPEKSFKSVYATIPLKGSRISRNYQQQKISLAYMRAAISNIIHRFHTARRNVFGPLAPQELYLFESYFGQIQRPIGLIAAIDSLYFSLIVHIRILQFSLTTKIFLQMSLLLMQITLLLGLSRTVNCHLLIFLVLLQSSKHDISSPNTRQLQLQQKNLFLSLQKRKEGGVSMLENYLNLFTPRYP